MGCSPDAVMLCCQRQCQAGYQHSRMLLMWRDTTSANTDNTKSGPYSRARWSYSRAWPQSCWATQQHTHQKGVSKAPNTPGNGDLRCLYRGGN